MEKYVVTGGAVLKGEVTISGAKNAVVAIIPATVLARDVCVIENIPNISDVTALLNILRDLGAKVRLCAPRTLLPAGVESWPVDVYGDLNQAVRDTDAVMCLRLQLERQQAGLLPDLREYSKRFCLTTAHMELARPGAHIMHPGPILRGLDVSDALADSSQSLILDQVSAGVSVRMAVLYLLATRPDIKDNL